MTKLQDLIDDYESALKVIDTNISNHIRQIKDLSDEPINYSASIKMLNIHLRESQTAKNLYTIFINDLKSLA